jgi:hypothetical protein
LLSSNHTIYSINFKIRRFVVYPSLYVQSLYDCTQFFRIASQAAPVALDPLPHHLIPNQLQHIQPPLIHYGFNIPYSHLLALAEEKPRLQIRSSTDNTVLVSSTVRCVSDWLQHDVFKGRVDVVYAAHSDTKLIWSLYTNYTMGSRQGRSDVVNVEKRIKRYLGDGAEGKWYIDSCNFYWRCNTV